MPGGLKQSASKEDFLKAVNLNLSDMSDKQRFAALWLEVTSYWNRHFETDDRHMLKPEYASNSTVTRPYKWAHFNPAFIDHAIREIWQNTNSTSSRYYYDLGASDDKRVYNWVLKWLLWHVCRYRDWRNRKKQPGGKTIKLDPSGFSNGDGHDTCELPDNHFWTTVMG